VTGWRARLAALKARGAVAESAHGGGGRKTPPAGAIGAIGANGTRVERAGEAGAANAAASYREAAQAALAALTADDPDLAHERSETAAALAGPAAEDPWHPGKQDPLAIGLLMGALVRPPSWSSPASPPPSGAWCSCCGRSHRSGGRWWREVAEPKGWRCGRCHPHDDLPSRSEAIRRLVDAGLKATAVEAKPRARKTGGGA
jgi:hypothetical protein